MKKIIFLIIAIVLLGLVGCSKIRNYISPHSKLWFNQSPSPSTRAPASSAFGIGERDIQLYRDFVTYNSYQKFLNYETNFEFRTDKDLDYLKENMQETIDKSFSEAFLEMAKNGPGEKAPPLISLLKKSVVKNVMDIFLMTPKILKIANGTFQFDFYFRPKTNAVLNYKKELSSNQLVHLENTGKLMEQINEEKVPLNRHVSTIEIPESGEFYNYRGGVITIWVKLLDMNWNLLKPIPNPKKNALKGFVRYRRYFSANDLNSISPFPSGDKLKVKEVYFKRRKKEKNNMVTVDIYKEFNISELVPKLDRMEVTYGKAISNNLHKNSIIGTILNNSEDSVNTGLLKIKGEIKYRGQRISFRSDIRKVVYDFNENKFSNQTSFTTSFPRNKAHHEQGSIKYKIRDILTQKYSKNFIESFHLDQFHKFVGGKK
jgi:hypothetical protein